MTFFRVLFLIVMTPVLVSGCLVLPWLYPDNYVVYLRTSVPYEEAEKIRTEVQESLAMKTRTLLDGGAPSCRYYEGVPVAGAAPWATVTVSIWACIQHEVSTVPVLEFGVSSKARNLPKVKQEVDRIANRIEQVLKAESGEAVTLEAGWFATP